MGKSHNRTPKTGITKAKSEKEFKQSCSRILRRAQRMATRTAQVRDQLGELVLPIRPRDVVETYKGPKDGKQWFNPLSHPELLRK